MRRKTIQIKFKNLVAIYQRLSQMDPYMRQSALGVVKNYHFMIMDLTNRMCFIDALGTSLEIWRNI